MLRGLKYLAGALLAFVLLVVCLAVIAAVVLGQPAFLAYVDSGSMEPTISTGDGYVPIPTVLAGEISEGDVITFEAEQVEGGDTTTHRVVEVTDEGFITQGDANPFTDQDSGEPPITEGEVDAVALQQGGEVVTIPYLGVAVDRLEAVADAIEQFLVSTLGLGIFEGGSSTMAIVLFALGVAILFAEFLIGTDGRTRVRRRTRDHLERIDSRVLIGGMAILLMAAATIGMVAPGGTTTFEVISSEADPDTPRVIAAGGESERVFTATNAGLLPQDVYVEPASEGVSVEDPRFSLGRGEEYNVTVTTAAPDETGFYHRSVREYRYLSILPGGVTEWLFDRHPVAPLLVINLLIGAGTLIVGYALVGNGSIRTRSRSRSGLFN